MALASYYTKGLIEAGCDEAGRGCLAGPVVGAAVILPPSVRLPGLNDSKKMSHAKREELRALIEARAVAWSVAVVSPEEIDRINILQASFLAMHKAISALKTIPQQLLIDGHLFNPYANIPHVCMIKGDGRYRSIAAASILAKTHRDEYMQQLHFSHPEYNWAVNKGYPTSDHRKVLARIGISEHHRRTFRWQVEEKEV